MAAAKTRTQKTKKANTGEETSTREARGTREAREAKGTRKARPSSMICFVVAHTHGIQAVVVDMKYRMNGCLMLM